MEICRARVLPLKPNCASPYLYFKNCISWQVSGHFWGTFSLCIKTSLGVKPYTRKCVPPWGSFLWKWRLVLKPRHKLIPGLAFLAAYRYTIERAETQSRCWEEMSLERLSCNQLLKVKSWPLNQFEQVCLAIDLLECWSKQIPLQQLLQQNDNNEVLTSCFN